MTTSTDAERVKRAALSTYATLEEGAVAGLSSMTRSATSVIREHPLASAGVILGAGVLVGMATQHLFRHRPTVSEVVMDALRSGASEASRKLTMAAESGLHAVEHSARQAMR
jgi:hypothetical protein